MRKDVHRDVVCLYKDRLFLGLPVSIAFSSVLTLQNMPNSIYTIAFLFADFGSSLNEKQVSNGPLRAPGTIYALYLHNNSITLVVIVCELTMVDGQHYD